MNKKNNIKNYMTEGERECSVPYVTNQIRVTRKTENISYFNPMRFKSHYL